MVNTKHKERKQGKTFMRTIPVRQCIGINKKTGKILDEAQLLTYINNTISLAQLVAQQALKKLWNQEAFDTIGNEYGSAYKAVEKASGIHKINGYHLDSRLIRLGEELAGRIIRGQRKESIIINNILTNTSQEFAEKTWYRNLQRGLKKHKQAHGKTADTFFDYKLSPPVAPKHILLLASVDKQFVQWDDQGNLFLKLSLSLTPTSADDWQWFQLPVQFPQYVQDTINKRGKLLIPSLRVKNNRVLLDLVIETSSPKTASKTKTVVGVDWGERRHLTLTDGWLDDKGLLYLSGRPQFFNAQSLQYLQANRRERAGALRSKRDILDNLLKGKPDQPELIEKRVVIEAERISVWSAYNRCSQQWAHAAARWIIEHAKAIGADTIILEDLKGLESRLPNKGVNGRVNHQVRGSVYQLVEHKAKMEGIKVQYVNARGTSNTCPLCQGKIKHHKAPNDQKAGRSWSTCTLCSYSRDRDIMAAQHIVVRGLRKHQAKKSQSHKPRRVTRPNLTPHKKSKRSNAKLPSNFNGERESHVPSGIAVRSQATPRASLNNWSQRVFHNSHNIHRDLHGLQGGYTGRIRLTSSRPSPLPKNMEKL